MKTKLIFVSMVMVLSFLVIPTAGTLIINTSPVTNTHIIKGASLNFTLNTSDTVSYLWQSPAGNSTGQNLTELFNSVGSKIVIITVNNSTESQSYTWQVLVTRPMSNGTMTTASLNDSGWVAILYSFNPDNPDSGFRSFFSALMTPYTSLLGSLFYVFAYILPLVVIWVRQEKALMPVVLMVIFGGLLASSLPESWQLVSSLFIVLTIVGIFYSLFKEKG